MSTHALAPLPELARASRRLLLSEGYRSDWPRMIGCRFPPSTQGLSFHAFPLSSTSGLDR